MKDLIRIAAQELGVEEVVGPGSNDRIMTYAKEVGFDNWYKDDDTAWCSLFMNWVALKAGIQRTNLGKAESWNAIGKETKRPEPGDIALFASTAGSTKITHVGIYMGYSQDVTRIYVMGGNQSNAVNISAFKADKLVTFRRLSPEGGATEVLRQTETTTLKPGAKGPKVVALQDALKLAGFDCGTSDGDYGGMTKRAIIALQKSNPSLTPNGVYDEATRKHLTALLENSGDINTR